MSTPCIDFHAHILPDVDHGSYSLLETMQQLEIIRKAEVDTVVATPHFYPNAISTDVFLHRVDQAVSRLLERDMKLPNLALGAEVLYCEKLEQMQDLDRLCIRGTDILLLELPMAHWSSSLFYSVESLCKRYTVVLAHIDRYVRHQKSDIEILLDLGALAQVNGYAFSSYFTRRKMRTFWEDERIVALGSDLHRLNQKAYDLFCEAPLRLGETYDTIMQRTQKLLQHAELVSREN